MRLPSNSPVRKLILLKPDDVPLAEGLLECKILLQMIYAERKKPVEYGEGGRITASSPGNT